MVIKGRNQTFLKRLTKYSRGSNCACWSYSNSSKGYNGDGDDHCRCGNISQADCTKKSTAKLLGIGRGSDGTPTFKF